MIVICNVQVLSEYELVRLSYNRRPALVTISMCIANLMPRETAKDNQPLSASDFMQQTGQDS